MFKNKSGKAKVDFAMIIFGIVAVALIFPVPFANITSSIGQALGITGAVTPSPTSVTSSGLCAVEDTTLYLNSEEMFAPATTPGGDNRVWINGDDIGLIAQGGSVTVSPGDSYVVLWVENSSTHYGKVTTGVVPCSGTLRLKESLYKWEGSQTSATLFNVWNEQGQVGSALTDGVSYYNITLEAGDVETVDFEIKGAYKEAMGNPNLDGENIVGCKYNNTAYDDIILTFDGFANKEVSCPQLITPAASTSWTCFAAPSVISNGKKSGSLLIDVDDTVAPSSDSEDIYCEYYDADYDIHSITNAIINGVEDDVDTGLGHTGNSDWNFTFHVT